MEQPVMKPEQVAMGQAAVPGGGQQMQQVPVSASAIMVQGHSLPPFQPVLTMPALQVAATAPPPGVVKPKAPRAPRGSRKQQLAANPPGPTRFKKSPDAPKRFKSAFIIFSAEKHREIKEQHAKEGRTEKTTDIAKKVSEAWRGMKPEEKAIWENKAQKDKARYEVEKSMYKGAWKVQANKRTPKDPSAPKRPMSAFLAFSNKRRAALKRENPQATNADLSKMLSKTWKTAPDDVRRKYMDDEASLRNTYKELMGAWRKRVSDEKKAERQEREAMAMQQAEAGGGVGVPAAGGTDGSAATMQPGMFPFMMQGGDMQQNMANFNPAMMAQFGMQGAAMQMQLSQLLAGQQAMQNQPGALGFYGQGLPDQNNTQGVQQTAPGMQQNPELAGYGSEQQQAGGQPMPFQDLSGLTNTMMAGTADDSGAPEQVKVEDIPMDAQV